MSLSSALDTAKSSLAVTQTQTSVISRNIANVNTVGATKKYATAITGPNGSVRVTSISQLSNTVLFRNMLDASSAVGKGNVITNGLDRINDTLGDTTLSRSPAAMVSALSDALNTLAASPNNYELARNAASAAANLVSTINDAAATVQTIRQDADDELAIAAADMTKILGQIEDLNKRIVAGTRAGNDITDLSDRRDQAVVALSKYVGVSTLTRADNDLVLYTDSGVTLFETTARKVEFAPTQGLDATKAEGNGFRIDGTAVTGSNAYMPLKSGSVAGLVTLRDDVMVTYQSQLDEISRGLIDAFKETSGPGAIATGLFTTSPAISSPAEASIGTFVAGAASPGDTLTFNFVYGDKTYAASLPFTAANTGSATAYTAALQNAINTAVPVGGGAALGTGLVQVQNSNGAFTLNSQTTGALGLSLFNVQNSLASLTGGLTTAATTAGTDLPLTAASIAVGTFDAGTIAAGDKVTLAFDYNGKAYTTTYTFAAAPTAATFAGMLDSAIAAAVPVGGGATLGAGKITAAVDATTKAITLATAATGSTASLGLSGVSVTAGNPTLHSAGLTAGASSTPILGLAAQLRLAPGVAADPTQIRDGVNFDYNTANAGGFTTRLNQISTALNAARGFSATSGADPSASIADYAASSISWLQASRQESTEETDYKTTLLEQTQTALSNETGINMDEQLTKMLELERSFQAASKLISTIDDMLKTLLDSI